MMNIFKIACIGECMIELQNKGTMFVQSFGGDTLNTALYLSRLAPPQKIRTYYVTALGTDDLSQSMIAAWQTEGINTELILQVDNKLPGLYSIQVDQRGEARFNYWRESAAAKYLFDQPNSAQLLTQLLTFDAIYLSGVTLAILTPNGREVLFRFLRQYKSQGGELIFDNNYRPLLWRNKREAIANFTKLLSLTDTALLTFDDEQALYGDKNIEKCVNRSISLGVKELIIRRGAKECLAINEQLGQYIPSRSIDCVIDTTAAGDSFSAGFMAKRFCGGTIREAVIAGHAIASEVIQHHGAIIPINAMPII
jgi:2-dehydro-3-deoxygluconokinase